MQNASKTGCVLGDTSSLEEETADSILGNLTVLQERTHLEQND